MILLTKTHIKQLLKNKSRVFIFLDFDGTLSPIVRRPDSAKLPLKTKKILNQLAKQKRIHLGIISGRSLADVKARVGLKNITYVGNHGLELEYCGKKVSSPWVVKPKTKLLLKKAKQELRQALKNIKGVILEDKQAILALHYRKVDEPKQKQVIKVFKKTVQPYRTTGLIKVARGKKVLELRPAIRFSKASAVKFLKRKFKKKKNDLIFFAGDDLTDESVFKILSESDLAVKIGKSQDSQANYYLKTPRQLAKILDCLRHLV